MYKIKEQFKLKKESTKMRGDNRKLMDEEMLFLRFLCSECKIRKRKKSRLKIMNYV